VLSDRQGIRPVKACVIYLEKFSSSKDQEGAGLPGFAWKTDVELELVTSVDLHNWDGNSSGYGRDDFCHPWHWPWARCQLKQRWVLQLHVCALCSDSWNKIIL